MASVEWDNKHVNVTRKNHLCFSFSLAEPIDGSLLQPIVATPEPVAEEPKEETATTVDAPPPPAEEAIAEAEIETKEVLEEPKV
nr:hypothetical protein [Tanacetum cinerariifolium]